MGKTIKSENNDIKKHFSRILRDEKEKSAEYNMFDSEHCCDWCGGAIMGDIYYFIAGETICAVCIEECEVKL